MLTAALMLALTPGRAACPDGPDPGQQLGNSTAPIDGHAYLDPASTQSWRTWLELRRVVADNEPELQLHVHWVGTGGVRQPKLDRVRAFVSGLAARGHAEAALGLVTRDGLERLHARLIDPQSHPALAQELRLPLPSIREALTDRCARVAIARSTTKLQRDMAAEPGAVLRLPVFVIGSLAFEDGPALERLRPEVGQTGLRRREHEQPEPPGSPPAVQATSDRMQRPRLGGLLLGGPGLAHRFVVMARSEDDPTLFVVLPPVLEHRRNSPGQMAVHVVSRGVSADAERLRHRLCAAQSLGLGSAYADYLARDALLRQSPGPVDERLVATLDDVSPARCEGEPDPVAMDLPDGAWLDGLPRSRAELSTLDATLRLLDAAWRPLDLLFITPPDEL